MTVIEAAGNSIENAINDALKELGISRNEAEIEVLDPGSKGFLGIIGSKQARVRVQMKITPENAITEFLEKVIAMLGLDVRFQVRTEEECFRVSLKGPDVRILIGKRGETLNALQLLTGLAINKHLENRIRIVIDSEGYRQRREETLRRLASRLSEVVHRTMNEVALEPMTPNERRIIHMALQDNPWVETTSVGDEPFRKVLIRPRKNSKASID